MVRNETFDTLQIGDSVYRTKLTAKVRARKPWMPPNLGLATAFIPGVIRQVTVQPGDTVERGQILVVLEAMKMENPVEARIDGVVQAVHVSEGDLVSKGALLVEIE